MTCFTNDHTTNFCGLLQLALLALTGVLMSDRDKASITVIHQLKYMLYFLYSAITGYQVPVLLPQDCTQPAKFHLKEDCTRHIIFTAETHNFPTGNSGPLIRRDHKLDLCEVILIYTYVHDC